MEQTGTVPPPQPPVACAVVPVDFTVFKKGQEMELHDATGRLAFRVAAAPGGGGGGMALLDAAGGVLVTVRSRGEKSRLKEFKDAMQRNCESSRQSWMKC